MLYLALIGVLLIQVTVTTAEITAEEEDTYLDAPQIVRKYGYPLEEHQLTTPDGYILKVHRIPHGKTWTPTRKGAVYLHHGIFCSSTYWVLTGPTHALAYILADQGYDVWLGNGRGNSYSNSHIWLRNDDPRFWKFTWHEMATIDLPTTIDYILRRTQRDSLFYVGHSQGTTIFYAFASTFPEYNSKIKAYFHMSPVVHLSHIRTPFRMLAHIWRLIEYTTRVLNMSPLLERNTLRSFAVHLLCSDHVETQAMCFYVLDNIFGVHQTERNSTFFSIFTAHFPDGGSFRELAHLAQHINSDRFTQYDKGLTENLFDYGSFKPPEYNLKAVTAPGYLFYSNHDWLSNATDVMRLCSELGDGCKEMILAAGYTHMNYMFGLHVPERVYKKILYLMEQHLND